MLDDRDCPVCAASRETPPTGILHLRATGEQPASAASPAGIAGDHHLIPVAGASRLAGIIARGKPSMSSTVQPIDRWGLEPTRAGAREIRSVLGYPLRFRGGVVGILVCYFRAAPRNELLACLPSFAAHMAAAIGNGRTIQEVTRLHEELEQERDYLREEAAQTDGASAIFGKSEAMARVLRQVDLVAPTEDNVLIQGEPGTGKELIARAIHERGSRSSRSLVKVNCASTARDLLQSALFGHVRGAFTGAPADRVGRFPLADRGTLFLDQVDEIPLDLQDMLLRALQDGGFKRVGDEATRHANVRVIAATSRDPRAEIDAGRFRPDLFYRLGVLAIQVPPLRERREDVPALTERFVALASEWLRRAPPGIPQREMAKLVAYDWPGNIRELRLVVDRAVILAAAGGAVQFDVRPSSAEGGDPRADPRYRTEKEWRRLERENLLAALEAAGGRVSGPKGAAARLGMNPNTLTSRLRALGLKKAFPGGAPNKS